MSYLEADRWYTYDTLNRLITARYQDTQNWGWPLGGVTSWYQYDDLGNRISHDYRGAGAIAYAHDKANRMTTLADKTQQYEDAGNLTLAYSADRGTSYIYRYDHHNRLTGVYDDTGSTRKAAFTHDALGRRIEYVNDVLDQTVRYYYDGVNEIVETDESGDNLRTYVHGISYVDERLMMEDFKDTGTSTDDRPYYYVIDRMYNVRFLLDRAGAIVERYCYDAYGRPLIRESCGRGDMNNDTQMYPADTARFDAAKAGTIWDPRADLDDDGDVDTADETLYDAKYPDWTSSPSPPTVTVAQAFSDVGNPFMFQGRVHFALDTEADATSATLPLNDHRARPAEPVLGTWPTRDSLFYGVDLPIDMEYSAQAYQRLSLHVEGRNLYAYLRSNPVRHQDPSGYLCGGWGTVPATRGWTLKWATPLGDLTSAECMWDYCVSWRRCCMTWYGRTYWEPRTTCAVWEQQPATYVEIPPGPGSVATRAWAACVAGGPPDMAPPDWIPPPPD